MVTCVTGGVYDTRSFFASGGLCGGVGQLCVVIVIRVGAECCQNESWRDLVAADAEDFL